MVTGFTVLGLQGVTGLTGFHGVYGFLPGLEFLCGIYSFVLGFAGFTRLCRV